MLKFYMPSNKETKPNQTKSKTDLGSNNPQRFIYHQTKKPNQTKSKIDLASNNQQRFITIKQRNQTKPNQKLI